MFKNFISIAMAIAFPVMLVFFMIWSEVNYEVKKTIKSVMNIQELIRINKTGG